MNLKNKTVLVTGADGFIGSHLVEKLHADGAKKIKAISLYNSFGSWGWGSARTIFTDLDIAESKRNKTASQPESTNTN